MPLLGKEGYFGNLRLIENNEDYDYLGGIGSHGYQFGPIWLGEVVKDENAPS